MIIYHTQRIITLDQATTTTTGNNDHRSNPTAKSTTAHEKEF